jgi:hypothetical protein
MSAADSHLGGLAGRFKMSGVTRRSSPFPCVPTASRAGRGEG